MKRSEFSAWLDDFLEERRTESGISISDADAGRIKSKLMDVTVDHPHEVNPLAHKGEWPEPDA